MFAIVDCLTCQTRSLAYLELNAQDAVTHVCSLCSQPAPLIEEIDTDALDNYGLAIALRPPIESVKPKTSGCKKGCGSKKQRVQVLNGVDLAADSKGCHGCTSKSCGKNKNKPL